MTKQEYLDYVNQQFDELEKYLSKPREVKYKGTNNGECR